MKKIEGTEIKIYISMKKWKRLMLLFKKITKLLLLGLLISHPLCIPALSIIINYVECVYEFILFKEDVVSGNFIIVVHDIFWGSNYHNLVRKSKVIIRKENG